MIASRRLTLTALFVAFGFLLVAVGGGFTASDPAIAPYPEPVTPGIATGGGESSGARPELDMGTPSKDGTAADRSIIRRADLSLTVDDIEAAMADAEAAVQGVGGETVSSSIGGWIYPVYAEGGKEVDVSAALEPATAAAAFRVPAARIAEAIAALRALGEVTNYSTSSEDVTASVVDLDARLAALEAAERSYLALVDEAANVAEVMSVYAALTEVRAQIESLEAQARSLAEQVEMAAIGVNFTRTPQPIIEATEGFDPAAIAERALGDMAGIGRTLVGLLIYGAVFATPLLLLLLAVRVVRRLRRR